MLLHVVVEQTVIHDLMRQSEVELQTPPPAPLSQFAGLPDAQREALLCVSDIWREKLCLDRSFLSAVYRFDSTPSPCCAPSAASTHTINQSRCVMGFPCY